MSKKTKELTAEQKEKFKNFKRKLYSIGHRSRPCARIITEALCLTMPLRRDQSPQKLKGIMETYIPEEKQRDRRYMERMKRDLLFSRMVYNTRYTDYFIYGFDKLNDTGRREYVGWYDVGAYTDRCRKTGDTYRIFLNKYETYWRFREFFGREMVPIRDASDRGAFVRFAEKHRVFILKPEAMLQGIGIEKIDLDHGGETAESVFERVMARGKSHVAEEWIRQGQEMARLHPASINTVRVATFQRNGELTVLFCWVKAGTGGAYMDQTRSNGLCAAVDPDTGIVLTPGYRLAEMKPYLKHPDTGVQIIGMQLPQWEELKALVRRLVQVVPEQTYVGWDLAFSEDGWILVEANDDGAVHHVQAYLHQGMRDLFNRTFGADS